MTAEPLGVVHGNLSFLLLKDFPNFPRAKSSVFHAPPSSPVRAAPRPGEVKPCASRSTARSAKELSFSVESEALRISSRCRIWEEHSLSPKNISDSGTLSATQLHSGTEHVECIGLSISLVRYDSP